jgi:hypothetical protein
MPDWLRRAGRGRAPDGAFVIWSVAEGSKGRRWREVVTTGEGVRSSLLLELDADGRFSHLELSTAAGLLTLHPEGDGTLHGNTVTADGVHHVVGLPWDADGTVMLDGSAVCRATARGRTGIVIRHDLDLREVVEFESPRLADPAGLPLLEDAEIWPLELEV